MASDRKQVFLVGLDEFNLETLNELPQAEECEFRPALTLAEMRDDPDVDIPALVDLAAGRMAEAPGGPAGVASFFDFPGTIIASILASRFGLPGPNLESLLKCEHKYWSRLEQAKVAPDAVPVFRAFDPFDDDAFSRIGLVPPFWIKPVKSFRSYLAYAIHGEREFADIMEKCRAEGPAITDPFLRMMRDYDMPPELSESSSTFIAESSIGGAQCTLEGYSYNGQVVVYGVVDSVRDPDSSSFARYEYPSMLPLEVQHRMMDIARAVIGQFGYDNGPFNAEFFYDQSNDAIWLLEINPRASQSHADLFQKVNGVSHFSTVIDLALGRKPRTLGRDGPWNLAAHFFYRAYEPGRVTYVPSSRALERLQARQPDTRVKIEVNKGDNLGDLRLQDSYSFELANVYVGGRDRMDVLERYDRVLDALQFEIEPPQEAAG
ncbi:ATP-grasp domain-containing protein [Roseovarius salinarum]|uniref:ATP-grasp domain-containing protein n=1 Tax=Roseovarius salinarum TaxID=1981892 RepID=UPI000C324732|nr:ATP-grasp domain-containing protein [Roseovarius salinarum]